MSGHSKWSTIKHKKATADAKRGAAFGKIARALSIAARDNPDPETNSRLKDIIQRARTSNMPKEKIASAISRMGEKDAAALSEIQLEFIGPGDAAIVIQGITDNRNRTLSELRKIASDNNGRMVNQGSVSWMFKKSIVIRASFTGKTDEQQLRAIDAGADDVLAEDDQLVVIVSPDHHADVVAALGNSVQESKLSMIALSEHILSDDDQKKLEQLLLVLDDHDDVQEVFTNVA